MINLIVRKILMPIHGISDAIQRKRNQGMMLSHVLKLTAQPKYK